MSDSFAKMLFDRVVVDNRTSGGLDEQAQRREPANFLRHIASLSASKIADGLINPKLVLSWLLNQLGAGSFWIGLLVPVREALALLPQALTASAIAALPVRKWAWAIGAIIQGLCAALMVVIALTMEGDAAGAAILAVLALLALARSVCSASYKDVLGKTVGSSRRGTATGLAGTAAAIGVIGFAVTMLLEPAPRMTLVIGALALASIAWIAGGLLFTTLAEAPSAARARKGSVAQFAHLKTDSQLLTFIVTRSLLVGTALAPPYLVVLQKDGVLGTLGALVLASSLATLVSSFVWGRLSDRSSKRVLAYSGVMGGLVLALVVVADAIGLTGQAGVTPALVFVLMIAYEGVRLGRSTHLVDMAKEETRASYTALSNTLVGLFFMVAGGVSAVIASYSVPLVIGLFSVMCLTGAVFATRLDDVQDHD